jgi:hypothetical protein
MNILKACYTCILFALTLIAQAQEGQPAEQKNRRYAVYLSAGPGYFFNNVQTGKNLVSEFNYQAGLKFLWEPEYFLSIGFETGYYKLYSAKGKDVSIENSAVPVHFVMSMNIIKAYYFDLSVGPSFLSNKVHSDTYGDFDGSFVSLADFSGTFSYKFKWKGRFRLGMGARFFYSSHTNDKTLSLLFIGGYKL